MKTIVDPCIDIILHRSKPTNREINQGKHTISLTEVVNFYLSVAHKETLKTCKLSLMLYSQVPYEYDNSSLLVR